MNYKAYKAVVVTTVALLVGSTVIQTPLAIVSRLGGLSRWPTVGYFTANLIAALTFGSFVLGLVHLLTIRLTPTEFWELAALHITIAVVASVLVGMLCFLFTLRGGYPISGVLFSGVVSFGSLGNLIGVGVTLYLTT